MAFTNHSAAWAHGDFAGEVNFAHFDAALRGGGGGQLLGHGKLL
jgi:hypothetical protein